MQVSPYLDFNGCCEEAIEFYRGALGAQVEMVMRFKDAPKSEGTESGMGCSPSAGTENKIMHASLRIGDTYLLASDGRCQGKPNFQGVSLSLNVADKTEATRVFNALSAGGQVVMPLGETFFSPSFGMTVDHFGVMWMVYLPHPKS